MTFAPCNRNCGRCFACQLYFLWYYQTQPAFCTDLCGTCAPCYYALYCGLILPDPCASACLPAWYIPKSIQLAGRVWSGPSLPCQWIGEFGDYYINTSTNSMYGPKTYSGWPTNPIMVGSSSAISSILSTIAAMQTQSIYVLAQTTFVNIPGNPSSGYGAVHMSADADDIAQLQALVPLTPSSSITDIDTQLNLCLVLLIEHCKSIGSITQYGGHLEVDTFTTGLLTPFLPGATDLPSTINLIEAMGTGIYSHGWEDNDAGHHFHDDITNGGKTYYDNLPYMTPTTAAECAADVNYIVAALITHDQQDAIAATVAAGNGTCG